MKKAFLIVLPTLVLAGAIRGQAPATTAPGTAPAPATQPAPQAIAFDTYGGYFVSNQFEPNAPASFVVLQDQTAFDRVFGVAMVMGDTSHRLPNGAFKTNLVVTAIKRGPAFWTFKVQTVTVQAGMLTVRYTTTSTPSASATYSCPLIVSVSKGDYKEVRFEEGGRLVKTIAMPN